MSDNVEIIFKKMIERSDEAFLIYNVAERQFIYANHSFEEVTRRSCEQLLKDPASMIEVIHPEDRDLAKRLFSRLLRKTTSTLLDFRIIRPDNTERWIRLKTYPIFEGKKIKFLTGIMEDDSARKASLLNMQKISGWKDSILEILAHDLRGPIGIVKMLAAAIDQQLNGNKNKEIRKWTKMIQEISNRNIQLIHALVKKESLDTANVVISKEAIDLVWQIGEVMKIFINSEKDASKQFQFTYSHDNVFAHIDSMRFLQIVNNLISNSIKFTGPNGVIKVHIEKLEKSALISVIDNGIGIPRSLQPLLFKKYTQAGRTGLDGQESIGLGMWIVKSFTDAHGGNVWFESEEGKGTKIYVEIPLRYEEYEQMTQDDSGTSKVQN